MDPTQTDGNPPPASSLDLTTLAAAQRDMRSAYMAAHLDDEMGLQLRLAKVVTWTAVSNEVRDELLMLID